MISKTFAACTLWKTNQRYWNHSRNGLPCLNASLKYSCTRCYVTIVERMSHDMESFLSERGTLGCLHVRQNPYQNGFARRLNRTLGGLARNMVEHGKIPKKRFCVEAPSFAAHLENRVRSRGIYPAPTSYEILFEQKTGLSHLRVFGFRCWYTTKEYLKNLIPVAQRLVWLAPSVNPELWTLRPGYTERFCFAGCKFWENWVLTSAWGKNFWYWVQSDRVGTWHLFR